METITRAESRKRLMMIERKTRHVNPKKFWFGSWVASTWQGKPDLSCGTTACSIGWATTIPYLQQRGLRLIRIPANRVGWPTTLETNNGFTTGIEHLQSVADFLGLTLDEYKYLFTSSGSGSLPVNATNVQVADLLRNFINSHFTEFPKLRKLA
jgi:hypothetical protein